MDHMIQLSGDMVHDTRWGESITWLSDEPMQGMQWVDLRMLQLVPMLVRVCLLGIITSISGVMP